MSWLFGAIFDSSTPDLIARCKAIHAPPLHTFVASNIYVALGGIHETCCIKTPDTLDGDGQWDWAVVGTGIKIHDTGCSFLSSIQWQGMLGAKTPDLVSLDGHFLACRWKEKSVELFTDQTGVRTAYVASVADGVVFSTRLDWISQFCGSSAIDFKVFSSQWLSSCPLTYDSPVLNTQRLGPLGYAKLSPRSVDVSSKPWTPVVDGKMKGDMVEVLRSLLHPFLENESALSIGLSGGLDSRLMLAIALGFKDMPWVAHVFGNQKDPDVLYAKRIAELEGFPLHHFLQPIPPVENLVPLLSEYVAQTQALTTASLFLKVRYYPEMFAKRLLMVDGAFAELGRRQLFNRLFRLGVAPLRHGNSQIIAKILRRHRAAIFTPDISLLMEKSVVQAIDSVWNSMPDPTEFRAENFLDLFAIRTLLANTASPPQAWLDSQIRNYMAFVQPSFLHAVFNTPLALRRNGRLYRKSIHACRPSLTRIPLVKEGETYPFGFSTFPALIVRKIKKKVGLTYKETSTVDLLHHLSEFVNDIVRSQEVRSYAPYCYKELLNKIDLFYKGDTRFTGELDWWLSFELWRRSLQKQ